MRHRKRSTKYNPMFLEALSHYSVVRYFGGFGRKSHWEIRYDGKRWTSDLEHLDSLEASQWATKRAALRQARRFALRDAMDPRFAEKVKPAGDIGRIPDKDFRVLARQ